MVLRVITKSKWMTNIERNVKLLPSDCVTDLRTTHNALSVWKIENSDRQDEIIDICMVVALNRDKLQAVAYVLLDDNSLKNSKFILKEVEGTCKCLKNDTLLKKHRDIAEIDATQLIELASKIRGVINKADIFVVSKKQIKNCIDIHKSNGDIDETKIKQGFFD